MTAPRVLDELWHTFCAAPQTFGETPGVRESWHKGRPVFCVWVLRLDGEQVKMRAQEVASALAPWITPQRPEDLHVTLWVAGFPSETPSLDDDVSWRMLEAQRMALAKLTRSGSLRIGALHSFLSVPFLTVHDDGFLAELRALLDVHGRELRFAPYVPHVTVGKYHGAHATAEIARAMEPWMALEPLEVAVSSVELVDVHTFADAPLRTRFQVRFR